MSEYIITCDEETASWIVNDVGFMQPIVRRRDCKDYEDTGNCYFWASYEPIPGGDEYREVLAEVTPNGYCAWDERRDDA